MSVLRTVVPLVVATTLLLGGSVATPVAPSAAHPAEEASASAVVAGDDGDPQVLAISLDGLHRAALRRLGHRSAPHLWRLVDEGAATLDARTQRELTTTLPNHTSMVTGRRITASAGGHGVTWNDDLPERPPTVQAAAGREVESLFSVAHAAGLSTALFAAKTKFSLFDRSWPASIDRVTILEERDGALAAAARRDLLAHDRAVTFLHLGQADRIGHDRGFLSPAYLRGVRRLDALVGSILDAADTSPELADLTIVLTSDHGGPAGATDHSTPTNPQNFQVPFVVWGPGVPATDLYDLNPGYRDPGTRRTPLTGVQPVRNGNLANVVLALVGLDPVPGSRFGVARPLVVTD